MLRGKPSIMGLMSTSISPEPIAYMIIGITNPMKWLLNALGRIPRRISPAQAKACAKTIDIRYPTFSMTFTEAKSIKICDTKLIRISQLICE